MATLTARLDDVLKAEVEGFWRAHGEGPSSGLRRVVEEWWAMQLFPAIAFRDGVAGRRAVVQGGPDVWEIADVAEAYGEDREGLHAHFGGGVSREAVDQALAYARRFPDEITMLRRDNERVARLLDAGSAPAAHP